VAHSCNLSYSGGRDQEHHNSKSAQKNNLQDLITKKEKPTTKKRFAQGISPEFKPHYNKNKR
jgi:hypothetical protein